MVSFCWKKRINTAKAKLRFFPLNNSRTLWQNKIFSSSIEWNCAKKWEWIMSICFLRKKRLHSNMENRRWQTQDAIGGSVLWIFFCHCEFWYHLQRLYSLILQIYSMMAPAFSLKLNFTNLKTTKMFALKMNKLLINIFIVVHKTVKYVCDVD